jgi:CubicO group peptidase (beta-lactamase class C family)
MRSDAISSFLQERIEAGDFPSAVYLVAEKGEIVFQDALGYSVLEPERIETRLDTVYDLASLTKPLVTALLYASLIDVGEIDLADPMVKYAPQSAFPAELTVQDLLTHTSGLTAWRPFYLLTQKKEEILGYIANRGFETGRNKKVIYSDLNYMALGLLIEKIIDQEIDEHWRYTVISRSGLTDTGFNPLAKMFRTRIAASENGNEYEKQTCLDLGFIETPVVDGIFRERQIWGEVHDGNAWFIGGVAGHAGLFSTADEVFRLALEFLPNCTTMLRPKTCDLFSRNYTRGANEDRSVGFQLASTEGSTAGSRMSPESFGHTGFTGTSLWIDPVTERVFVLLTNRTHAHKLPFVNINSVRRRFHDMAIDLLDKKI